MIVVILVYGLIAGLIVAVPMVASMLMLSEAPQNAALYGYTLMILALTAVFLGVKHYRDKVGGGVIRFWPALVVGLGIGAVASAVYAIGWEISLAFTGFDYGAAVTTMMVDAARARGASDEELAKVTADAAAFAKTYANPLYRLPITFVEMFPIGVLIALVSAALLRNNRFLPAR
ncbi:MAG TPA: DUF4199 domain-containing protein [Gammaproteobacteria bacterium]|nr:DUF4199 domain-containing protein [Gammaproteobacteria bacterium]